MRMTRTIVVVLVAAAGVFLLWRAPGPDLDRAAPHRGLPWDIELLPGGMSRVFGLVLGSATFGEALELFGRDMELAVVARAGEQGQLEAYYGDFSAGLLTGRLIVVADADREAIRRFRERAVKSTFMDSGARKFTLQPDDLAAARQERVAAITFVPSANVDEETVLRRFGAPAERVRAGEHAEHLFYPDKGLDLLLDARGKEILQYVAPREFERVRAPPGRGSGTVDRGP